MEQEIRIEIHYDSSLLRDFFLSYLQEIGIEFQETYPYECTVSEKDFNFLKLIKPDTWVLVKFRDSQYNVVMIHKDTVLNLNIFGSLPYKIF